MRQGPPRPTRTDTRIPCTALFQSLFALKPQLHRVEAEHPIYGEMLADRAEEGDVFQPVEPFGIVQHHGVGRSVAKAQELLEYPLDRGDVGGDHLIADRKSTRLNSSH